MCGGQYIEDKTCSIDTFKIGINKQTLKNMETYLKSPRMHHSMIYMEEKDIVLAVGGEDENGNQLDTCELYNCGDNSWRMLNTLNNRVKNAGLCKFTVETKNNSQMYIYCFGKYSVERVDLMRTPIDTRWEELNVKIKEPLPFNPNMF